LFELALRVKTARLRLHHPDWTAAPVRTAALRLIDAGCR